MNNDLNNVFINRVATSIEDTEKKMVELGEHTRLFQSDIDELRKNMLNLPDSQEFVDFIDKINDLSSRVQKNQLEVELLVRSECLRLLGMRDMLVMQLEVFESFDSATASKNLNNALYFILFYFILLGVGLYFSLFDGSFHFPIVMAVVGVLVMLNLKRKRLSTAHNLLLSQLDLVQSALKKLEAHIEISNYATESK